jgi:hypothetical protein
MSFNDIKKGYEDGLGKDEGTVELTNEEKELLDTKEIDKLTARAKLRLQYLKNKIEKGSDKNV